MGIFLLGGLFLGLLWVEKYLRKWYNSRNHKNRVIQTEYTPDGIKEEFNHVYRK